MRKQSINQSINQCALSQPGFTGVWWRYHHTTQHMRLPHPHIPDGSVVLHCFLRCGRVLTTKPHPLRTPRRRHSFWNDMQTEWSEPHGGPAGRSKKTLSFQMHLNHPEISENRLPQQLVIRNTWQKISSLTNQLCSVNRCTKLVQNVNCYKLSRSVVCDKLSRTRRNKVEPGRTQKNRIEQRFACVALCVCF